MHTTTSSRPARGRRPSLAGGRSNERSFTSERAASHNSTDRPARKPRTGASTKSRGLKPASRPSVAAQVGASDLDLRLDAALALPEPPAQSFAELGLPKAMVLALTRRGITTPFAIQTRALPDALAGRDVLGRAQTGSGKTLAFGLPMLTRLAATVPANPGRTVPRGLVLVPTRELAHQVADNLVPLGHTVDLRVTMVYGGAPIRRQIDALRGKVDVVVATPGRLLDLIERGALTLGGIEITVLDEADHMADLGFLPDVRKILNLTAPGGQRLLFSATLDKAVARLVAEYLPDPTVHAVAAAASPVDTMEHVLFQVTKDAKFDVAAEIAARPARTLFFVATKHGADRLARRLSAAGVAAGAIHGNLNQNQRTRALAAFTSGQTRVLVATDVAARGIHVDDVDLVVHFDPPNDDKTYLHRSGRTARAGATGTVLSLVEHSQVRETNRMHRNAGVAPAAHIVTPGHAQVRVLASSGTPITVVIPEPTRPDTRAAKRPRHHRYSTTPPRSR
ncbi:MAG: DEAD/DEAH box helicase [Sporichthyaceae bacterium]